MGDKRLFYAALSTIWEHRREVWAWDAADSLLECAEQAYITALEIAQGRLNSADYISCRIEPDLTVCAANECMGRYFGCVPEKLEGAHLETLSNATSWPRLQAAIARCIERKGSVSFEVQSRLGCDGLAVLHPVFHNGQLHCIYGFCYLQDNPPPRFFEVPDETEVRLIE